VDLRHVRYFVAVVDAQSLAAASRVLRVAQPSLSRQLQRLEADLGLALFDRTGRRLRLTALGRYFVPIARDLIRHSDLAVASAHAMASGATLRLTGAAAPATVTDILAPYIAQGGPEGLITNVLQVSPENVYEAVRDGRADFAIGTRVPLTNLAWRVVGHTYPWAQYAPSHPPLTSADWVSVDELLSWPLIVMTEEHAIRRMFDDAVTRAGLAYQPAFETTSNYVAQALAAAGRGVCILSDHSRFGLRAIPITSAAGDLNITLYGAWDPRHFAVTSIVESLELLERFIAELYTL